MAPFGATTRRRTGLDEGAFAMTFPGFFQGTGMPDAEWWEALWPNPACVLAAVGIVPGMDAVDLCSGDGWFTLHIAQVARHVIAIDIDGAMLAAARARLADRGLSNCKFVAADANDVAAVVAEPVDHVFLANVFHGVPNRARLCAAVRTVLKPKGRLSIVNWHARPREETVVLGEPRGPASELRMTPDATRTDARAGGLQHVGTVEVSPYHYAAVFEPSEDPFPPRGVRQRPA